MRMTPTAQSSSRAKRAVSGLRAAYLQKPGPALVNCLLQPAVWQSLWFVQLEQLVCCSAGGSCIGSQSGTITSIVVQSVGSSLQRVMPSGGAAIGLLVE